MTRRATVSPAARRDVSEAIKWLKERNPPAAANLQLLVRAATTFLGTHPRAGSVRPEFSDGPFLFYPLAKFPYMIVYRPDRDPPRIVRVLHTSRDIPVILRAFTERD